MSYTLSEYRLRYPAEAVVALLRGRLYAYQRLAATGGDLTHVRVGKHHVYLLNHPEIVRELLTEKEYAFTKGKVLQRARFLFGDGLVASDGPVHRRHRKLVSQAFHVSRIRTYADTMVDLTLRARDRWRPGEPLRIDREMERLTLEIVAQTLFGSRVGAEADAVGKALRTALRLFTRASNPLLDVLWRLSVIGHLRLRSAQRRIDDVVYRIIGERRRSESDRGDLLSMLLAARDSEEAPLSDRDVRDEVMTLFLTGYETSAVALAWTCNLLASHREVEQKLQAEVDAVLQGRRACFEDVERLAYTRQVIREAMRLYPPVWAFARQAKEAVDLGGHPIQARSHVLVSPYLLHRSPLYWNDPERFDPDRFAPERKGERPRFAYLPFSMGSRGCIGEHFAWTEAVLVLATIAQRWSLRFAQRGAVSCSGGFTLRPGEPIELIPQQR